MTPPPFTYGPKLREKKGSLSRPQWETIVYACQAHEQFLPGPGGYRRGFFLGDGAGAFLSHSLICLLIPLSHPTSYSDEHGAGVGKGRQIAALIWENLLEGRLRSIWISVSKDLQHDARRDLNDIGAEDILSAALSGDYGKIQLKEGMKLSPNPQYHTISQNT